MKKTLFFFFAFQLFFLNTQLIQAQSVSLAQGDYSGATFTVTTPDLQSQIRWVDGEGYVALSFEGSTHLFREGEPDLPVYSQMIEVPLCSDVQVTVSNVQTDIIVLPSYPLLPMQPAPSKADSGPRAFVMDSSLYSTNAFYAAPEAAWVELVGTARDRNLAILRISPISYNPVTGQIQLITSMTVKVTYRGVDIFGTRLLRERHASPAFTFGGGVLATLPTEGKDIRNAAPLHYLIVAHSSFRGALDSFVAWKRRQGFLVTVGYTDDEGVGTSPTSIAGYIKGFYTNATEALPAPTYLLLVGDHQQIPAFDSRCTSPANDHVSDLYYTTWTDGDNVPDCYIGRFSARNLSELTPQIEKTIYYESYAFADDSYLRHGVLISGVDRGYSGDNAYTYADPAMDYIAKTYINASNGYNTVHYYKNNINFAPTGVHVDGSSQTTATASYLRTLYDEGCGWVNYSAHGYDNEWSTPLFTSNNAASMTNYDKPSIMVGNCCLSGKFNSTYSDACLGEALLRRNGNAGAAAYFGATNSTYWPHDFCWAVGVRSNISNSMDANYEASRLGMYDRLFHTHNENYSAWHITAGSINMAGNMAVQSYGSYALYYWEIYELFGDPSLMPWLGQATDMVLEYPSVISIGTADLTVQAVPYAYVAITTTEEHDLVCAAYANATGEAHLRLPADLTPGTYELVAWAQNRKPVFENITVAVLDGPYVMITQIDPVGEAHPGEVMYFDITITNVGNTIPTAGLVTLTSDDAGVTIIQPVAHFTECNPGDTVTLHTSCPVYLSDRLINGKTLSFVANVDFGPGSSIRKKSIKVSAPLITVSNAKATPQLLPDSASTITCRISNIGSTVSKSMTLTLVNDYGFLNQSPDPVQLEPLAAGENLTVSFRLTLNSAIPQTLIPFYLYATTADNRTLILDTLYLSCGINHTEDFESGDFSHLNWTHSNHAWTITNTNVLDGTFCARSTNNLPNLSESRLNINWSSQNNDSIIFYYKVSSEEGYDQFVFSIDGSSKLTASGEVDWTRAALPVEAGSHIFTFRYSKDRYSVSGSDCAWIDNITLPFSGNRCQFDIDQVCQNSPYEFAGQIIPTSETGIFSYSDTTSTPWHYLALTVLEEPDVNIEIISNSNYNQCLLLKAHGAENYLWSTGDTTDCIAVCPEHSTTYTVTGFRGGCSGEASTTLVSIDQPATEVQVSVYPNPAHNNVTIDAEGIRTVQLVNVMGQVVSHQHTNTNSVTLDLQKVPTGIYFIRIETANSWVTKKLIRK